MARNYVGRDSLGQMVGFGDLVAVTKRVRGSDTKREFLQGIVTDITAKNGFKLAAEDGTLLIDGYSGRQVVFPQNYTLLIVHADELDNHRRSIIEWEKKNTVKAGN